MKIALCDDNELFLKNTKKIISDLLTAYGISHNVFSFISGEAIINAVKNNTFDIIFLDIDMPGLNGKDVAQQLRIMARNRFKLVFISDYYEEVFYTFKYDIESFIPKKQIAEFLPNELRRIIDIINKEDRHSFSFKYSIDSRTLNGKAFLDEIMFIESLNGQVFLHTVSYNYKLVNYKFEKIKEQFNQFDFVDIHRTCFVNIAYISSVEKDNVFLKNGDSLPLSRRKRNTVNNAFFLFVKDKVAK